MRTVSPSMRKHKKTSQYRGVCWDTSKNRWRAYIRVDSQRIHLGMHADEIEAARAYDRKARECRGDRARLNFPPVTTREDTGVRELQLMPARGIALVPLDDDGRDVKATIDLVDADRVGFRNWSHGAITKSGHPTPVTSINGRSVSLARYIMDALPGERVSYDDGNPLNCRRANLVKKGRGRLTADQWEQRERELAERDRLVAEMVRLDGARERVRRRIQKIDAEMTPTQT